MIFTSFFFQQKAVLIASWHSFLDLLHGTNFAIKISAIRQTDGMTCYLDKKLKCSFLPLPTMSMHNMSTATCVCSTWQIWVHE